MTAFRPVADWIARPRRMVRPGVANSLRPWRIGDRAQPVARARVLEPPLARRAAAQPRGPRTAPRPRSARDAAQPTCRRADGRSGRGGQTRRSGEPARRGQGVRPRPGPGISRIGSCAGGGGARVSRRARREDRTAEPGGAGAGPAHSCDRQSRRAVAGRRDRLDRRRPERNRTRLRGSAGFRPRPPCGQRSGVRAKRAGGSENGCRSASTCRVGIRPTGNGSSRGFSRPRGSRRRRRTRSSSAALVEPLSSAETSLLAALAPLAADSPRDAKRFLNAYRLARCSALAAAGGGAHAGCRLRRRRCAGGDARPPRQGIGRAQRRRRSGGTRSRRSRPPAPPTTARYRSRRRAPRRKSPAATPCRSERRRHQLRARHRRGAGAQVVAAPQAARAICRNCPDK